MGSHPRSLQRFVLAGPDNLPDIVEETLKSFKANVFFQNFDVKVCVRVRCRGEEKASSACAQTPGSFPQGSADRLLIYLTLYTHQCVMRISKVSAVAARPSSSFPLRRPLPSVSAGARCPLETPGGPGHIAGRCKARDVHPCAGEFCGRRGPRTDGAGAGDAMTLLAGRSCLAMLRSRCTPSTSRLSPRTKRVWSRRWLCPCQAGIAPFDREGVWLFLVARGR